MKIYLSNYWKANFIFSTVIVVIITIATTAFCIWSHDAEDYIMVICASFFVFLFCYLISISIKLVRYVVKDSQQLIMRSFRGEDIASLSLEKDVYYEVLSLIEGTHSKKDFIVLSNMPFKSYRSSHLTGLAEICKAIDKNGNQIIMSYKNKFAANLFDVSSWRKIS